MCCCKYVNQEEDQGVMQLLCFGVVFKAFPKSKVDTPSLRHFEMVAHYSLRWKLLTFIRTETAEFVAGVLKRIYLHHSNHGKREDYFVFLAYLTRKAFIRAVGDGLLWDKHEKRYRLLVFFFFFFFFLLFFHTEHRSCTTLIFFLFRASDRVRFLKDWRHPGHPCPLTFGEKQIRATFKNCMSGVV